MSKTSKKEKATVERTHWDQMTLDRRMHPLRKRMTNHISLPRISHVTKFLSVLWASWPLWALRALWALWALLVQVRKINLEIKI